MDPWLKLPLIKKILLRFVQALKCSDDQYSDAFVSESRHFIVSDRNADLTRRHATQGCLIEIQQPVQK